MFFDRELMEYRNKVEDDDELVPRRNRTIAISGGKARGELVGGNLTVLTALAGSPYLPDFAGNSYFNTFGNLLREPATSLLFIDFAKGDLLQLQGVAQIVWNGPELSGLDGARRLLHVEATRAWRRNAALPLLWSEPEPAPTTLATGSWRHDRAA